METRPVIVFPSGTTAFEPKKIDRETPGRFHTWAGTSEHAYALIELVTGHMIMIRYDGFKFDDPVSLRFQGGVDDKS